MKTLTIIFALVLCAFGQTPAPIPPDVNPAWLASLPTSFAAFGGTWERGATHPMNLDGSYGQRLGQSRWYAWIDMRTPIFKVAPGAAPTPSTVTAGAGYVPICSPTGSVCLIVIALGGVSAASGGQAAAPAFTGSVAVSIRLHGHLYLTPYGQASNASYSATSGALATAVISPGVWLVYGFGGK